MSWLELLGAGVLLSWLALPVLALTVRHQAEAEPTSRHRQLVLVLGLGALLLLVPAMRSLVPVPSVVTAPTVTTVVAQVTEFVADRDDGPGPLAIIALVWVALVTVATGRLLYGLWVVRAMLRRAEVASEADTILALQAARALSVPPTLVLVSKETAVPFVASVLRPCVVLPANVRAVLSDAELACVFQHELLHLQRSDQLWALVLAVLRVPFALHPTAKALAERAALACEEAVDAIASKKDARTYAHTLVTVAELSSHSGPEASGAVFMSARALSRRITMLTASSGPRRLASAMPLVVAALLLAVAALAAPTPTPADDASAKAPRPGKLEANVSMKVGEARVVTIAGMQRVAVGDPSVVDVKISGKNQLTLIATGQGRTTLLVWVQAGSMPISSTMTVR